MRGWLLEGGVGGGGPGGGSGGHWVVADIRRSHIMAAALIKVR